MMPPRRPLEQRAIIMAFFAILLLPGLQMITRLPKLEALDENRVRERAPKLSELAAPVVFISQSQRWFADHYGYRDWLIRAKTQIDYSVFGISDRVYVGKEGWLFLRNIIDNEEIAEETMSEKDVELVIDRFIRLRDCLRTRGIRLIVITNEMKDRFYPEYLPYEVRGPRRSERLKDFKRGIRSVSDIAYIDSTELLMAVKSERPVFHKTDLHWNDPAAAEVARTLVDTIASLERRSIPFWRYPLNISLQEMSGGEARFMPLFYPPKEQCLAVDPNPGEGHFKFVPEGPFSEVVRTTDPEENVLPAIVLCGDSFSDGMIRAGLYGKFAAVYKALQRLKPQCYPFPPDVRYFVYQFIETRLPNALVTELNLPLESNPQVKP